MPYQRKKSISAQNKLAGIHKNEDSTPSNACHLNRKRMTSHLQKPTQKKFEPPRKIIAHQLREDENTDIYSEESNSSKESADCEVGDELVDTVS